MLSAEQQRTIESSRRLVNGILKELELQRDEDLRQEIMCYLCECIQRFNPDGGTKWTTYAYANVWMFVKRYKKRARRYASQVSDFTNMGEQYVPETALQVNPQHAIDSACLLKTLYTVCTPEEVKILELKRKGYKLHEIAKTTSRSVRQLSYIISTIKQKAYKIIVKK